jgi:hypothetical protein
MAGEKLIASAVNLICMPKAANKKTRSTLKCIVVKPFAIEGAKGFAN